MSEEKDTPTVTEALAAEESDATVWPADAPEMTPLLKLSRRDRASVLAKYAQVQPAVEKMARRYEAFSKKKRLSTTDHLEIVSAAADAAADVQDMLAMVAKDREAFDSWAATLSDMEMLSVFIAWSRSSQLGEG